MTFSEDYLEIVLTRAHNTTLSGEIRKMLNGPFGRILNDIAEKGNQDDVERLRALREAIKDEKK